MKDIQVRIMRAGASGKNAWTPVISVVPDGFRLVMQIANWVGGEGVKPVSNLYIGPEGYVDDITKAVDVKGVGQKGWSPVLAVMNDDERRVLQVFDWTGGEGQKPATGQYIGLNGLVDDVGAGIDVRGSQGVRGIQGEQGIPGQIGPIGPQGGQGLKGEKGDTGLQGERGLQGLKGDTGDASAPDSVTNVILANMPVNTIKGRMASDGDPQDLTTVQAWGLIGPAGKATVAQLQAGTDDTQFITPAKIRTATGKWLLQKTKLKTPVTAIVQSIPAEAEQIFISGKFIGNSPATLLLQLSADGGVSYADSYAYAYIITAGAAVLSGNASMSGLNLGSYYFNDPSWAMPFSSEIQLADIGKRPLLLTRSMQWAADLPQLVEVVGWGWPIAARATHLRIFASTGSLQPGTFLSIWGA